MSAIDTATIELTRTCNFRCGHCYIETVPSGGDQLPATAWISIIDRLMGIGCRRFVLTGGECLLSPSFPGVYEHLCKNGCAVQLFTNGSVLKPSHVELFIRLPPESISVTVYGENSEQYRHVTGCGGPVRDIVMRNVAKLKEMGIRVHLGTILCDGLAVTEHTDGDGPEMNTYLIPAVDGRNNLAGRLSPADILRRETLQPQRNARNLRLYSGTPRLSPDSPEYLKKCSGGHSSIFVGAGGRASICAIYREVSHDLTGENISLPEILQSLSAVHRHFKDIYFNSECGGCRWNRLCRNCPAYSLLETGRPDKNPYLCELARVRAEHYGS